MEKAKGTSGYGRRLIAVVAIGKVSCDQLYTSAINDVSVGHPRVDRVLISAIIRYSSGRSALGASIGRVATEGCG